MPGPPWAATSLRNTSMRDVAADAIALRQLHVAGTPLVLANAWDPPTAALVAAAGFPVVATSSAAVAQTNGFADHGHLPATVALDALARLAAAVTVPVTADMEDGYGLGAHELVTGLIEAGACGLNVEDSDHHNGGLVDVDAHAERIAAIKDAARAAGVDLVLNARIDVHLRGLPVEDGLRRAARYRAAGADCLYPIGLSDVGALREYAAVGPVNALYRPGSPAIDELAEAMVSRISVGAGLFTLALQGVRTAVDALRDSRDPWSVG
ncbi:MAG: isocitrate lyase/PEP mutase family protein [Pseudonocardiaceae bacterium]